MKKEVVVCDGCGKILEKTSEVYHLCLKTDKFWSGADMDYNVIQLDFCSTCARQIKDILVKIYEKLQEEDNG